MRSIAVVGSAVILMASHVALADCPSGKWPEPAKKMSVARDFDQARRNLEKSYLMKMELVQDPTCPSMQIWKVVDNLTGLDLVNIPVPLKADGSPDSAALKARVVHVFRTPKKELRALASARKQFLEDQADVKATMGVDFVYPGGPTQPGLPSTEVGLQAKMAMCSKIGPTDDVIDTSVKVNMIEYNPSKRRYLAEDLYRQGQIRARLVKNPGALRNLARAAAHNAANCNEQKVGSGASATNWAELAAKFSALAGPEIPPHASDPAPSAIGVDAGGAHP